MKIDVKIVFMIITVSSLLGLTYNYFSPSGIPLIPEEKTLKWASDSLFNPIDQDEIKTINTPQTLSESAQVNGKNEQLPKVSSEKKNNTDEKKSKSETKKEVPVLTEPAAIDLRQAYHLYEQKIIFIDAREPEDYKVAHIKNAVSIPFDHFDDYKNKLNEIDKNQPIVTYCAGTDCDLSILLGNLLFEMGYKHVYVFFGGWNEWVEANYPTEEAQEEL